MFVVAIVAIEACPSHACTVVWQWWAPDLWRRFTITLRCLLFTTKTGHQLHASAVKRSVTWSTVALGRRIHDLRHTAACLWLSKGVDAVTSHSGRSSSSPTLAAAA